MIGVAASVHSMHDNCTTPKETWNDDHRNVDTALQRDVHSSHSLLATRSSHRTHQRLPPFDEQKLALLSRQIMEDDSRDDLSLVLISFAPHHRPYPHSTRTHHLDQTRNDDEPDDDPRDPVRRAFLDVFVDDLEEVAGDGQTLVEDLNTGSDLEVFPDGLVQWV